MTSEAKKEKDILEITKGENANLAGMEPRCPKCGEEAGLDNYAKVVCDSMHTFECQELHELLQFFRTTERPKIEVIEVCPANAPDKHSVRINGREIVAFDYGHEADSVAGNLRMALAQFFRSPAPTPPLDVEARELEEAWSMLVERGVRIYTLSTALIDRDAYARTERAITQLLSLLRRHIASPAPQSSRTYGDLPGSIRNMVESHEWDNKNISEQRDYALDMVEFLERELGNFRRNQAHAASPAQPEKRDELIGKVVRVDNPQFTGFGVAQYDSGEHKRMIGVKLENGNTWKYDAETVRLATPEEIKQAPRVVQAWAAPPQSGKEGQS